MTVDLQPAHPRRRGALWAGRASRHRRDQVTRAPAPAARVQPLWESLVDVLRAIESPASALLCTADGAPVAAYGLPRTDLPQLSRRTRTAFAARARDTAGDAGASGEVEVLELTSGPRHTVIASVPGAAEDDHLLSVTAEGVSPMVLQAWTRQAAAGFSEVLAAQS